MTLAKVYTDEEKYEVNISVPHSKNTSKEIFINSIIKSGLIIDKKDKKIWIPYHMITKIIFEEK